MAKTNQINVKVNDPTNRAIEEFAEDRDYTKAEAVRRITESRLRGEGYLSREIYGDQQEPVTDGGQVIRPILSELNAIFTVFALVGVFLFFSHLFVRVPVVSVIDTVGIVFSSVIWAGAALALLYTNIPEIIDQELYARKNRIAGWIKGVRS